MSPLTFYIDNHLNLFIRLNYYPVKTLDEVVDVFVRETNDPKVDSVEGIMYSLNEGLAISL